MHADLITGLMREVAPDLFDGQPFTIQQARMVLRGPDEPTSADVLRTLMGQRMRIEATAARRT
jgi:hypothetical protein